MSVCLHCNINFDLYLLSVPDDILLEGSSSLSSTQSESFVAFTWDPQLEPNGIGRSYFRITHNANTGSFWFVPNWNFLTWIFNFNEDGTPRAAALSREHITVCQHVHLMVHVNATKPLYYI